MTAYKYRRGETWYLGFSRNGVPGWKSTRSSSARVADDYLRRLKRGEAIPELSIPAESGVRSQESEVGAKENIGVFGENLGGVFENPALTVNALCDRWLEWCAGYYRDVDGKATGELDACKAAVAPLTALYGGSPAAAFGPLAFKVVRDRMISLGWVRSTVNRQCGRVKRCFAWGVENELFAPGVLEGLRAVRGLRKGRSAAVESEKVGPVPDRDVKAVLKLANRQVCAMIMSQLLSGARPGEVVRLRPSDFDCSSSVWVAILDRHKTSYRERSRPREIYFGPRAQAVIKPFFDNRPVDSFLFSPAEAMEERIQESGVRSQTEIAALARRRIRDRARYELKRGKEVTTRVAGECYTVSSYRRAIERICEELKIPVWNPNQLRHNAATAIRRKFGLEAVQPVLGHARADTSEIYAEVNRARAVKVIGKIG